MFLSQGGTDMDQAYANDIQLGSRVQALQDSKAIRAIFPPGIETGSFEDCSAYLNRDGGWANATKATAMMLSKVRSLGGRVLSGQDVISLLHQGGGTTGVVCADGVQHDADLVVLSVGSWTASAFPSLGLAKKCVATAYVE